MSKFLYPIYKLKTKSYIKWWLYHKKAGGSGVLSEILEGFSFNLENTLNRKFNLFEIQGNSVQDGSPSPDNEVPIKSAGDNGSINEKITNADGTEEQEYSIFVQQPMRSIGDVRDCFVKKSDGWYERHYIGRNYLKDYSYYFATTTDGNLFRIVASQLLDIKKIQQTLMCNIFIGIPSSTNRTNGNIYYNSYAGVVDIICDDYDNETDFKTMTINKNGYFDCILAEPLDLPCTPEQIEALENKPSTYKEMTIIQSEDETPAHLKIQYYKEG